MLTLDNGVTSTDTNIVDSHLGLVSSSELEFVLVRGNNQQMDVSGRVLVEWHGLEQDVVGSTHFLDFLSQIDDLEDSLLDFESVGIHVLADLAFKSLPVERPYILGRLVDGLFLLLSQNPTFEALEVDKSDGSFAFACQNKWVGVFVLFIAPTDSALNVIFWFSNVIGSLHLHSFL